MTRSNKLPQLIRSAALAAGVAAILGLTACGGGGGGGGDDTPIPLDDPNGLMSAISDKVTAGGSGVSVQQGTPPAPTGTGTPKAEAGIEQSTALPGDTVSLPVNVEGSQTLSDLYAKIPGATSYFQVPLGGSGGKRALKVVGKQSASVVIVQTLDFRLQLPTNLATGGQFCFEFTVRNSNGDVSDPVQSCITVAAQRPQQPANDQPATAELGSALAGTWLSECFDVEDQDVDGDGSPDIRSAKLTLSFEGSVYAQGVQFFGADDACGGAAQPASVINGNYSAGDAAFNQQTQSWQRPIDFVPDDPEGFFQTCYNLLRIQNTNTLFLGFPLAFAFDTGTNPEEGDCRAQDTRPETVITALPFTR